MLKKKKKKKSTISSSRKTETKRAANNIRRRKRPPDRKTAQQYCDLFAQLPRNDFNSVHRFYARINYAIGRVISPGSAILTVQTRVQQGWGGRENDHTGALDAPWAVNSRDYERRWREA